MEDIKNSMSDMMKTFTQRMNQFESGLQKSATPSTVAGLAADYADFKAFITGALRALQLQIEYLAKQLDNLEMRGRRKILLVHGVVEQPKENLSQVAVKLVVDRLQQSGFTASDISRCHRMGRGGTSDRARPILIKFRDESMRSKIWSAKSKLKGTGITLSEFLTKARHGAFMAARERFGITRCWTMDGVVFVLGADGVRHRALCVADLASIEAEAQVEAPRPAVKEAAKPKRLAATRK